MGEPVLRVEALEAGYDEVQVLWGISLGVAPRRHDHAGRRQRCRQDDEPARHHGKHPNLSAAGCSSPART